MSATGINGCYCTRPNSITDNKKIQAQEINFLGPVFYLTYQQNQLSVTLICQKFCDFVCRHIALAHCLGNLVGSAGTVPCCKAPWDICTAVSVDRNVGSVHLQPFEYCGGSHGITQKDYAVNSDNAVVRQPNSIDLSVAHNSLDRLV